MRAHTHAHLCVWQIVLGGALHGFVLVPVLLSLVGPRGNLKDTMIASNEAQGAQTGAEGGKAKSGLELFVHKSTRRFALDDTGDAAGDGAEAGASAGSPAASAGDVDVEAGTATAATSTAATSG